MKWSNLCFRNGSTDDSNSEETPEKSKSDKRKKNKITPVTGKVGQKMMNSSRRIHSSIKRLKIVPLIIKRDQFIYIKLVLMQTDSKCMNFEPR